MADTASTTFPKSAPVPERSTRQYSATLVDLDAVALEPGQVTSIRFSLRNDQTDVVINDRNRVEVLNANGGTFTAGGAFKQVFSTLDTVAIGTSKLQKRRALFEVTYTSGIENHEVFFWVENLEDLPPVTIAPATVGAVALLGYAPTPVHV